MEKASEFVLGSVHQDMELHLLFQSTFFKYFTNETKLCIVSKRGGSQVEVVVCSQHLLLVVMVVNEFVASVAVLYLHM